MARRSLRSPKMIDVYHDPTLNFLNNDSYCTRQTLADLYVPRPNFELFKECLFYQGPILWNRISDAAIIHVI